MADDPSTIRHGPLTLYLAGRAGCADLGRALQSRPADEPVIWLDSARHHPVTGRWSMLGCDPWLRLSARGDLIELQTSAASHRWRGDPLKILRDVLRRYQAAPPSQPHGRAVGLMGYLTYEMNHWIEPTRLAAPGQRHTAMPDMAWYGMGLLILVDHLRQRTWIISVVDPHAPRPLAHEEARGRLAEARTLLQMPRPDGGSVSRDEPSEGQRPLVEATSTRAEFEAMVNQALEHIRAGDIFQANVAQRMTSQWEGSPRALYQRLRRINPSPFACFLAMEDAAVVSSSPERLVRVQDGWAETRPIAGTRPRGATPEDDALNSLELLLSEKERAEHLMLVDLERNDLGRICASGSVQVSELMALEEYSHVIHIVSQVSGRLRPHLDAVDVIRAVFPGGTITGCPKVRCMELLRELEPVPRGLYTGSLGYLGFDGTMDLNIAIRTLVIEGSRVSFHVGAGIVADSDPSREYEETMAKAGALLGALHAEGARIRASAR